MVETLMILLSFICGAAFGAMCRIGMDDDE